MASKGKGRKRAKIKISKKPQKNELYSILQAFDSMEQGEGPPKADPKKCSFIAERIREHSVVHASNNLVRPQVKFSSTSKYRGIKIPTKESWEEALSYYECFQDNYIDKLDGCIGTSKGLTPKDFDDLIALELWFVQIIEPPPNDSEKFSSWEKRELSKVVPGISTYCVKKIRLKFGLGLGNKLPKGWGQNHKEHIETIKRSAPKINVIRPGERTVLPTRDSRPRTSLSHLKTQQSSPISIISNEVNSTNTNLPPRRRLRRGQSVSVINEISESSLAASSS